MTHEFMIVVTVSCRKILSNRLSTSLTHKSHCKSQGWKEKIVCDAPIVSQLVLLTNHAAKSQAWKDKIVCVAPILSQLVLQITLQKPGLEGENCL